MLSAVNRAFARGVLAGLAAPFAAFNPPKVRVTVEDWVKTPSYRPWSEDRKNLQQDFAKVIGSVSDEISAAENARRKHR